MPKDGDERKIWINAIEKHQVYDLYKLRFKVCELHFTDDDLRIVNGKKIKRKNASPSIFDNNVEEQVAVNPENVDGIENGPESDCSPP